MVMKYIIVDILALQKVVILANKQFNNLMQILQKNEQKYTNGEGKREKEGGRKGEGERGGEEEEEEERERDLQSNSPTFVRF